MSVQRSPTRSSTVGNGEAYDGQLDAGRVAAEQAVPGAGATAGAGSAAVNQRANTNGGEQVPTRIITAGGGGSLPVAERLRGQENYSSWAFAIKMVMIREGTWAAIRTENPSEELSERALATICLSIDPMNYSLVQNAATAKEAWDSLKSAFQDCGYIREFGLLRQLTGVKLVDCASVEEYVNLLMSTRHKLSQIGFEVNDRWMSSILLMGLPKTYEPMIMGLEASGIQMRADTIRAKILQDVKWPNDSMGGESERAFYGQSKGKPKSSKPDKSHVKCFRCKQAGHYASECQRELKSEPQGSRRGNHQQQQSTKKFDRHTAFMVQHHRGRADEWIFDSGTSSHMCREKRILKEAEEVSESVIVANNMETPVVAKGKVTIEADVDGAKEVIHVSDVLCIPELAMNLLSVHEICKRGHRVVFTKDVCEVFNESGHVVAVGKQQGGLYRLCQNQENVTCLTTPKEDISLWHRRMGHLNVHSLKQLREMVSGVQFCDVSLPACVPCLEGKHQRQTFKFKGNRAANVLELVHSDLCGPMETASIGGSRYFLTFIDDCSRKCFIYFLRSKTEVLECFKDFQAYAETQTGQRVKRLRSDNGTEFVNKEMKRYLRQCGIQQETTVPYNPEQNGLAERMNRTIVERARCLLFDAELDKSFWAEAVGTATYLINRSPTKGLKVTPEERFSGMKPDLSNLHVFGTRVMTHIPKERRKKWDRKSEEGIFIGYAVGSKGYRIYNPRTRRVFVSRDAMFLNEGSNEKQPLAAAEPEPEVLQFRMAATDFNSEFDPPGTDVEPLASISSNEELSDAAEEALPPQQDNQQCVVRRSGRERRIPGKYHDFKLSFSAVPQSISPSQVPHDDDPQSYTEALLRDDNAQWQAAMEAEMKSLDDNRTWELTELPAGRKALKSKWVYKIKTKADGTVERYKARLVIKGFSQIKGVDYGETYSPVVRYATVRYLMAVAARLGLQIYQLDAVTAFLQGDLQDEEIYMEQPEGFVCEGGKVCRLKKALYGLKQASRVWNAKLDAELRNIGLHRSKLDTCVYYLIEDDKILIVAVYVDDLLIFSNDDGMVAALKQQLMVRFQMKDLGLAEQVLGMHVTRTGEAVMLDQERYIEQLLERFGMTNCNPVSTPFDPSQRLTKEMCPKSPDEVKRMENVPFRELVGGLQFLAQCTRPDIAFAVNAVSSFCSNPGEVHWTAAKRILRYLKGTKSVKLVYDNRSPEQFHGYTDADWGNDTDTRRSVTGYVFMHTSGAVAWSCKRQPTVALSTTEAEYMAVAAAGQEALWWRSFRAELSGVESAIPLRCDNRSAISLAEKEVGYSARTKHIDLRHHFIKEQLENKTITLQHVASDQQLAV